MTAVVVVALCVLATVPLGLTARLMWRVHGGHRHGHHRAYAVDQRLRVRLHC